MHIKLPEFQISLETRGSFFVDSPAINQLESEAQRIVQLYLGKTKPVRPSRQVREFEAIAKSLKRVSQSLDRLGAVGFSTLFAMSFANRDVDVSFPPKTGPLFWYRKGIGYGSETTFGRGHTEAAA